MKRVEESRPDDWNAVGFDGAIVRDDGQSPRSSVGRDGCVRGFLAEHLTHFDRFESPIAEHQREAPRHHVVDEPRDGRRHSARFGSGLGAYTFLRPQQVVRYDADALRQAEPMIVALSRAEDLPAHGDAVTARLTR